MLIGIGSSLQELGPFPFHGGEGTSGEPVEMGYTIDLPQGPTGVGSSTTTHEVPGEAGSSAIAPQDPRGVNPSAQEQGRAQNGLAPTRQSRGRGVRPPNVSTTQWVFA